MIFADILVASCLWLCFSYCRILSLWSFPIKTRVFQVSECEGDDAPHGIASWFRGKKYYQAMIMLLFRSPHGLSLKSNIIWWILWNASLFCVKKVSYLWFQDDAPHGIASWFRGKKYFPGYDDAPLWITSRFEFKKHRHLN